MKHYIYLLTAALLMICQGSMAQSLTASGKVVDSNQEPLIGATVKVVGQNAQGSVTDLNGYFSLACRQGDVLEVSYIGYLTQQVRAAQNLNIVLQEDAHMLDETIVVGVGYGTMRKSDLTGSIASVNAKDMKQGVITSTEQLLQGKVAGLSIGQSSGAPEAGASIRLRGGTSLSASNGPLVVVDGIPGVDINSVQPSEIVSMDILKDASAAAIYGSRGANGVIIVTTNRQGGDVEQNNIHYNGYVAFAAASKKLDLLSANQWRGFVRERNVLTANDYGANDDYQDALLRTAISHSHNLSFSNSKKNSGYRASVTYNNNQGVIERNSMNRLAGSLTAYQTGWQGRLRLDEGINANFDSWHPVDTRIFERMTNVNPTFPIYNPDGSFSQLPGTNTENPVELNTNRSDDQKRHRFLAYLKAELEIIDGLKYTVNTSYEQNSTKGGLYKPTYARLEGQSMNGWGQRTYADYTNKQLETYLTYDKQLADIHRLNVMAGYSYLDNVYEGFGATRQGFDTDRFLYNNLGAGTGFQQGDVYSYKGEATLISFFGRVNYTLADKYMLTATVRHDGSSRFGDNHKWGTFPSVSLAWRISNEKFMEGTKSWLSQVKFRGSYSLTADTGPSWVTNAEAIFMTKNSWRPFTSAAETQIYISSLGNSELTYEKKHEWNFGVDLSFLKDRIALTFDIYGRNNYDLIGRTYTQGAGGEIAKYANVADMESKGIEIGLSTVNIEKRGFTWTTDLIFSRATNKITSLEVASRAVDLVTGLGYAIEGFPVRSIFSYQFAGLNEEGLPQVYNEYGDVTIGDVNFQETENLQKFLVYEGPSDPTFYGSFNNVLTYKSKKWGSFALDLFITYAGGNVVRLDPVFSYAYSDIKALPREFKNRWAIAGDEKVTNIPVIASRNQVDRYGSTAMRTAYNAYNYSTERIANGDFIRLKEVALTYILPDNWLKRTFINKASLKVAATNLCLLYADKKLNGQDPEFINSGGVATPISKQFTATLRLGF